MPSISLNNTVSYGRRTLNLILLHALDCAFPGVAATIRIRNQGQGRVSSRFGNAFRPDDYGEEYSLNCPFCGDLRGRMRVSHTYDPAMNGHVWHCFNEQCHKDASTRAQLANRLMAVWAQATSDAQRGHVPAGLVHEVGVSQPTGPVALPAGTVPLSQLPPDHPACQYVQLRGFDPAQLATDWGLGYSPYSPSPSPGIRDRLVIPIFGASDDAGSHQLLGWQARAINDLDTPKYLSMAGFRKSQTLYLSPGGVAHSEQLLVCEGVTDVWRFGGSAVALFGKSASPTQLQKLVELARHRQRVLIALDRDAEAEAAVMVTTLQARLQAAGSAAQVLRIRPPGDRNDFGACAPDEIAVVTQNAAASAPEVVNAPTIGTVRAEPLARPRPISASTGRRKAAAPRTETEIAVQLVAHATGSRPAPTEHALESLRALGMELLHTNLECPLLPILREIERHGLRVDERQIPEIVREYPGCAQDAVRLQSATVEHYGRVKTTLSQLGTVTGRITAKDFPLQNLSKPLRSALIADPGRVLLLADYRQYEWRIAAWMSQDPLLLEIFRRPGSELYRLMAAGALGIAESEVSSDQRQSAKEHLMRLLYSIDRDRDRETAADRIRNVLRQQSAPLWAWLQATERVSGDNRVVQTPAGRRVLLPGNTPHELGSRAVNYLVQATAADVLKAALIVIRSQLCYDARILLPHHDALLIDCPESHETEVRETIRRCMEAPVANWQIPLTVQIRSGNSWGACS